MLHLCSAHPFALHALQVFSKVGDVKRIVMGLDKQQLTPCGFCFVVYYTRTDTEDCVKCASILSKWHMQSGPAHVGRQPAIKRILLTTLYKSRRLQHRCDSGTQFAGFLAAGTSTA